MSVVNVTAGPAGSPVLAPSIWFVGCGNMAGAMVEGWRSAGVDFSQSVAIRPSGTPVPGLRTVQTLGEAGRPPELLLLGFKPQMLRELAPGLANWVTSRTAVVSILAGVEVATLRELFPRAQAVVRVMPNVACAIRRGVTGLYSADADEALRTRLRQLFMILGLTVECTNEAELATIGSVAGAGPAYVARFIEALARAGEARGLDPQLSLTIARETVFGTGWLAATTGAEMDEIVRRVRSPNGTTAAGLAVLEPELPALVGRTIDAAARRGAELAAAARAIDSPEGAA
ncbi:pyrroline-5-carboxylate reductase [Sphingomonas sp. BN140010]|uniref:Pyrroline-5-carboxylate reductase n=1 Tax=Sphingomonas arvum TaxID=2992113 RepID=A0ABT3JIG6_9SPHN|nr:pyrroline-5-carboxylate reductase dimerization domain-containing protein [Sphingomonas sp. BN140010]MCW3798879.1 pyrroline-5-carboxylate reductase [Sphingomonas sp. BN140010]